MNESEYKKHCNDLGVSPDASLAEMKAARKVNNIKWHPDKNIDRSKEERDKRENQLKIANNAFDELVAELERRAEQERLKQEWARKEKEQRERDAAAERARWAAEQRARATETARQAEREWRAEQARRERERQEAEQRERDEVAAKKAKEVAKLKRAKFIKRFVISVAIPALVLLTAVISFFIYQECFHQVPTFDNANLAVGDTVKFGYYTWDVLEVEKNKALLLASESVGKRSYDTTKLDVTSWKFCTLQKWLNSVFLVRFNNKEREMIIQTKVERPLKRIIDFDSPPWVEDTYYYSFFILSYNEMEMYNVSFMEQDGNIWLRTGNEDNIYTGNTGNGLNYAVEFYCKNNSEEGRKYNSNFNDKFEVYPAFWLQL